MYENPEYTEKQLRKLYSAYDTEIRYSLFVKRISKYNWPPFKAATIGEMEALRVVVCGGRSFDDYEYMKETLDKLQRTQFKIQTIIHGGARGADTCAQDYADEYGLGYKVYPVKKSEWRTIGKAAGILRNKKMLNESRADVCVGFWNGTSKGTRHAIETSVALGLITPVFLYEG